MPAEITMPQLSDTMSEGTLVKWNKKEGDKVKAGDEIAEVETDKATMPMEAFESGTLAVIAVKEGQKVKVGDRLAVIATAGEKVEEIRKQFAGNAATKRPEAKQPAKPPKQKGRQENEGEGGIDGASSHDIEGGRSPVQQGHEQSRRELLREPREHTSEQLASEASEAVKSRRASSANGAGASEGGAGATATLAAPAPGDDGGGRLRVSPLARRIAADLGLDLSQIQGSGPGGRIVRDDVLAVAERPAAAPAPQPPTSPGAAASNLQAGDKQVIPLSKMRAVIAARLQQSKQTVPHFYETIDVDVEAVSELRERLNKQLEAEKVRISLGDFVAKALGSALLRHPALNATFDGAQITRYGGVNLGIAVALPDGLIVPVLRGVNHLGLREIRMRSADLVERARAQRLKGDELSGATFSVSNLGAYGVREFSAIINPPEVGILAVGAAERRAVVRDGQIVARTMMSLTLSADHRAVDGASAADFLRTLKNVLEEPGLMLV